MQIRMRCHNVPSLQFGNYRLFVRKKLIKRPDIYASALCDGVGRQAFPSDLGQNVSRRLNNRIDGRTGTCLSRDFPSADSRSASAHAAQT